MAIVLDHTIVPAHDKEASARFLARILGLRYEGPPSHFAPLRINDTLTLDFDNDTEFESHHYAFKVDEAEFDAIFERVRAEGLAYGSGPGALDDMKINRPGRPRSTMTLPACCESQNAPLRLVSSARAKCSSSMSSTPTNAPEAALLTRMSR